MTYRAYYCRHSTRISFAKSPLFCGRTSPSNVPVPCEIVYTGTRREENGGENEETTGEGRRRGIWRTGGGGVLERNDLRTVRK